MSLSMGIFFFFITFYQTDSVSYQDWDFLTRDCALLLSQKGRSLTLGEKALSRWAPSRFRAIIVGGDTSNSNNIMFSACKHRSTLSLGIMYKHTLLLISDLVTSNTGLVSTQRPGRCGHSPLCILAEWSLVSHSRLGSPLDLSWCTGMKTWGN